MSNNILWINYNIINKREIFIISLLLVCIGIIDYPKNVTKVQ